MVDMLNHKEAFEIGVAVATTTPGTQASEEDLRHEGTDLNIIMNSAAAMVDESSRRSGVALAALLVDTAVGDDLDRLAADLPFPVSRNPASSAVTNLIGVRPNFDAGAGIFSQGDRFTTPDGIIFQITADTTVGPNDTTATVPVQAVITGPGGNVEANTISTPLSNFWDTSFTWTHSKAAGGNIRESDDLLRARIRGEAQEARRATLAAVELGARSVPQVSAARAYDVYDNSGNPTHWVELIVADDSGTGSDAMKALVLTALDEYAPAGIPVEVVLGIELQISFTFKVTWLPGFDTEENWDLLRERVVASVNSLQPKMDLDLGDVQAAAKGLNKFATGVDILEIISPTGNISASDGTTSYTIRTSKELITRSL